MSAPRRTSRLTAVLERTLAAKADQAAPAHPATGASPPTFDPAIRRSPVAAVPDLVRDRGTGSDVAPEKVPGPDRPDDVDPQTGPDHPDRLDDVELPRLTPVDDRAGGRLRRLVLPAAACLAVAALVGGALVALSGDGTDDLAVQPLTLGDPPDGWLVPGWVPEGMTLWGMDAEMYTTPTSGEPSTIPQLLGDPDAGRAILVTSHRYGLAPAEIADVTEVTVRGQAGAAGTGWGAAEEDLGDAVEWDERGMTLTALYRGATLDEAIAVLDGLDWRSDDPREGFEPPADEAWPLRAEATSQERVEREATLVFNAGGPAQGPVDGTPTLTVHTSSSSETSAWYLEAWYLQGAVANGGNAPITTYRDDWHELSVQWPDGRSIVVSPEGDRESLPHQDVLERVASSVAVRSATDLEDLRAEVDVRIAELPVLASAETSIGTVDVHGIDSFVRLCLRRSDLTEPGCNSTPYGGGRSPGGSALASTEWTVDGTWSVAVASQGEHPEIVGGTDRTAAPDTGTLPAEVAVDGDWTIRLVQPAPDIDEVCTSSDGGAVVACLHHRPD